MNTHENTPTPSDAFVTALGHIGYALGYLLVVAVKWTALFPAVSIPLALAATVGVLAGPLPGLAALLMVLVDLWAWRRVHRPSFDRWVTDRARVRWLRWWRYRRRWDRSAIACGLHTRGPETDLTPRLVSVVIGANLDRLTVRMLPGQNPDTYHGAAVSLAHTFGVQECRTKIVGPGVMELVLRHRDSLAEPITLPTPSTTVEWLWDQKEAA
ncbi:hypothetical protein ACWEKT_39350 [Nocardia takedensis]